MTIQKAIYTRVRKAPPGKIFFVSDFKKYDNEYVSKLLSLLVSFNVLERLARGIYYKPIITSFGKVYPTTEEIIKSIERRDKIKIFPTGEVALNALGFSTQVPMNLVYITTGSPRTIKVGNKTIHLKHRANKNYTFKSRLMPLLVLALKAKGRNNIYEEDFDNIRKLIRKSTEIELIRKDISNTAKWIKSILKQILKEIDSELETK